MGALAERLKTPKIGRSMTSENTLKSGIQKNASRDTAKSQPHFASLD